MASSYSKAAMSRTLAVLSGVKGASLVRLGDDSVSARPTLTINGGTFTQDNFAAIKVDRGTLHFKGGTVNGNGCLRQL